MAKKTVRDVDVARQTRACAGGLQRADQGRAGHRRHPHPRRAAHHRVSARAGLPRDPDVAPGPAQGRVPTPAFVLDPVAMRLAQLLGAPVRKVSELSAPGVEAAVAAMKPGDVLLLENSRFDPREKKNDPSLVRGAGPSGRCLRQRRVQRRAQGPCHHRRSGRRAAHAWPAFRWSRKCQALDGAARASPSGRSWWCWAERRSPTRSR